ncbi:MAG: DegT/DnrJ/EryC1/StrS family aminotransferase [Candidatus Cloacimonetes bacterium]|nr:DegT/DnrJ/EryC1/StrS family aminotransferase [Candidatus Cloacimonadota bacterium]
MKNKFISQIEPWFGEEERIALNEYMKSGGWLTEFKQTQKFEKMIADYTGAKYCFTVNNGTISLTLASLACDIQAGDEVIVPNYTMIATPNSIKMFGAVPIFVDVEPETLCLDIELVKKAITPETKAIMLVSANGRYPQSGIAAFVRLAKESGLFLIEDSAQALGSFYPDGRHIGTVGDVGSFSFSSPKVISTGQGGAIITNDNDIAYKVKRLKDFGRSGGGNDVHDSIGYNFKFTDLQGVIGIEQMKKLQWRVERKKEILKHYKEKLKDIVQIKFFEQDLENTTPWFIDVLVENREELQKYLKENNIGTRVMYPPINKQKAYNVPGEYPVSNIVGEKGLWLPSSSQLANSDIDKICNTILEFFIEN